VCQNPLWGAKTKSCHATGVVPDDPMVYIRPPSDRLPREAPGASGVWWYVGTTKWFMVQLRLAVLRLC